MMIRHRLLARQVRKYLGPEPPLSPEWERLLCAVQEAYDQFDNDRRLTERAMDLSSNELVAANERLLAQNQANLAVLEKLRNSVRVLRAASGGAEHPVEDDVLVLTAVLDDLIRQRRNAEQALRESEERLQNIVDNTSAVIFVKDLELRYILVNREFERRHHVERDQIRGKTRRRNASGYGPRARDLC
jgi:PAS domain-containing protein